MVRANEKIAEKMVGGQKECQTQEQNDSHAPQGAEHKRQAQENTTGYVKLAQEIAHELVTVLETQTNLNNKESEDLEYEKE